MFNFSKKDSIDKMIDDVIRREGGYVNHPSDKGGPTKYGITQETLTFWQEYPASEEDVKELKEAEARQIYRVQYYEIPSIDLLPEEIQSFMFDSCVNHGAYNAVCILQSTINSIGYENTLKVDGLIGRNTAKAAAWLVKNAALYLLVSRRKEFYLNIVAKNPSQNVFLEGWLARIKEFIA